MTVAVALGCALMGLITARCVRPPAVSVFPPFDTCCACLATESTPRGARCSSGNIVECISDIERLDVTGMETNIRCLRDVCGTQCALLASQIPSKESVATCCQCLADGSEEGSDCYGGTAAECADEIEEGEINALLQGAGLCLANSCQQQCSALFGAQPDAGTPDAATPDASSTSGSSSSGGSSGGVITTRDGGPFLPWDGGCPGPFPCF